MPDDSIKIKTFCSHRVSVVEAVISLL